MENYIIIGIIVTIAAIGIFLVTRKKGRGCCSGGGYKIKKKKLDNVIYKKTFTVEGMHCEHCKNRVEEAINDLDFVSGSVNLKRNELTVSYSKDVSDDIIKAKIKRVGYEITDSHR